MDGLWSVDDSLSGTTNDLYLQAAVGPASPACADCHFIDVNNDGPFSIGKLGTTTQDVDYFLDGDAGQTNMSPDNIDQSRTPTAPTA